MFAPLAKTIDWSVLQLAYSVGVRHAPRPNWKLEEAQEFLKGFNFIPAQSEPAQIEFTDPRHFRFPTPCPGDSAENNTVYGWLYQCTERWQEQPVVILLDGNPSLGYHTVFPLFARRFNRAGLNVTALVAPYHHKRHPRRRTEENCLEFAHAMAQQVSEIRAMVGWLLQEGCPSVGLLGFSFGGWVAGLTACYDARVGAVVMTVPGVAFRTFSSAPVIWPWIRQMFHDLRPAHAALDSTPLNLILSKPVIPKENILLIEGIYDQFGDPRVLEELWLEWAQPEIWRLRHGHVSGQLALGLMGRVLRWLPPRLEAAGDKGFGG